MADRSVQQARAPNTTSSTDQSIGPLPGEGDAQGGQLSAAPAWSQLLSHALAKGDASPHQGLFYSIWGRGEQSSVGIFLITFHLLISKLLNNVLKWWHVLE